LKGDRLALSSPTSSTSSTASGGQLGTSSSSVQLPHPKAQWGASTNSSLTPSSSPQNANSPTSESVVGATNNNTSSGNNGGAANATTTTSSPTPPSTASQHQLTLTTLHVCL